MLLFWKVMEFNIVSPCGERSATCVYNPVGLACGCAKILLSEKGIEAITNPLIPLTGS